MLALWPWKRYRKKVTVVLAVRTLTALTGMYGEPGSAVPPGRSGG